jgi:hypothetical protein
MTRADRPLAGANCFVSRNSPFLLFPFYLLGIVFYY